MHFNALFTLLYIYMQLNGEQIVQRNSFEDKSTPESLKCMQEYMPVYSTNAFQSTP